jgi:alpha,alpha-trehalase
LLEKFVIEKPARHLYNQIMQPKIADYGMIGNCRSMALVSKAGSIDWACFPDFDSKSYFCRILDEDKGGFFSLAPVGFYQSSQIYKENTNILKTDFFNHSGRLILTDFMTLSKYEELDGGVTETGLKLIRRIKSKQGSHRIRFEVKVTPDFAQEVAEVGVLKEKIFFLSDKSKLILSTSRDLSFHREKDTIFAEFDISEGDSVYFALGFYGKTENPHRFNSQTAKKLYRTTKNFWLWWVSLCRYNGVFKTEVLRSALALKLLTFAPTGAVIAAPTTSLPERLGGELNWDYRYVWLRDASFTMYALLGLGYLKEAVEFMGWLEKVCLADGDDIQIMYGLRGEKKLTEKQLSLSGYQNSRPVRVGNKAYDQRQLDIFGEVLTCINLFSSSGGELNEGMKQFVKNLVDLCAETWKEKDAGIWEPRSGYQHHTYSKLMCWVGIDRGLKISKRLNIEADFDYWKATKDEIEQDIIQYGFDQDLGAFVEFYGSKIIDSSNLNIPLVGFLPADDPTVLSTLDISMSRLTKDWFVYRTNDESDKLKAGEGAFFLSTFWVIDTLSILGRVKEAKIWLEKILYFSSPVGLYAEMFDPETKEHLGNYPQAFTHLGLINSILHLNKAMQFGPEKFTTTQTERLREVVSLFHIKVVGALELLIPSWIVRISPAQKRRTKKHSLMGRLFRTLVGVNE